MRTAYAVLDDPSSMIDLIRVSPDTFDSSVVGNGLTPADAEVVLAARVSYGVGLKTYEEDVKRIRSIVKRGHTSCLEQVEYTFCVTAPIFVARQWMRHRTGQYNELSMRYTDMTDNVEMYMPFEWRLQHPTEKQGSLNALRDEATVAALNSLYLAAASAAYDFYEAAVEAGVSRELARIALPVSTYTTFRYKTNLKNLLDFLRLRGAKEAQQEIRAYASQIAKWVEEFNPVVYAAWSEMYGFKHS